MKIQGERPLFRPLLTRADAALKAETSQQPARAAGAVAGALTSTDQFARSTSAAPAAAGYAVPKSLTRAGFPDVDSTGGASTTTSTSTTAGAQQLEQDLNDLEAKKHDPDPKVRKHAEDDDEPELVRNTQTEIINAQNKMKELAAEDWSQNPAAALEYAQLALETAEKHKVLSESTALEDGNKKKLVEDLNGTQRAVDQIKTTLADKAASEVTDPDAKAVLELARTALGI